MSQVREGVVVEDNLGLIVVASNDVAHSPEGRRSYTLVDVSGEENENDFSIIIPSIDRSDL